MVNKCQLCKKEFEYPYLLERHKKNKKPCNVLKQTYNCELCRSNFEHRSHLDIHNKTKKHINNYNIFTTNNNITNNNITNNFNNTNIVEDELKIKLQQEYEDKLNKELELKEE